MGSPLRDVVVTRGGGVELSMSGGKGTGGRSLEAAAALQKGGCAFGRGAELSLPTHDAMSWGPTHTCMHACTHAQNHRAAAGSGEPGSAHHRGRSAAHRPHPPRCMEEWGEGLGRGGRGKCRAARTRRRACRSPRRLFGQRQGGGPVRRLAPASVVRAAPVSTCAPTPPAPSRRSRSRRPRGLGVPQHSRGPGQHRLGAADPQLSQAAAGAHHALPLRHQRRREHRRGVARRGGFRQGLDAACRGPGLPRPARQGAMQWALPSRRIPPHARRARPRWCSACWRCRACRGRCRRSSSGPSRVRRRPRAGAAARLVLCWVEGGQEEAPPGVVPGPSLELRRLRPPAVAHPALQAS